MRLKFWSVSLHDQPFSRYEVVEKSECMERPQNELNTWVSSQKYLHALNTFSSEAQILVCFALRLAVSKILGHQKSEMHWMTPNWASTLNSQKYFMYTTYLSLGPICTLHTYPWGPNFGPFCPTTSIFQDTWCTRLPKIGMHRMTPNWTRTLNSQKYFIYTIYKYLPLYTVTPYRWGPNYWPFSKDSTFYNSPFTTMLNTQEKNKKKLFEIFKFHNCFTNLCINLCMLW